MIYVVHEGERVKKGQVMLEIQGLEIGEIKGEFIRTQAALTSAEANFKRQEKLRQENIAAEKAYIEANAEIMEVLDSDQVWAIADIYEKDLNTIEVGRNVEATAEAWPEAIYSGKLEYISAVVNQETRTVKVRSTLENRSGK